MNAPAKITPNDARSLTTQQILAAMARLHDELNRRGSLGDAPTDLLNDLDAGDNAARGLLGWLGEQEPVRPMRFVDAMA